MKKFVWFSAAISLAALLGVAHGTDLGQGQFTLQDMKSGHVGNIVQTYPALPLEERK